ncbi:MAG: TlpA family protein disulfide reductase [Acidimicrobiales bacterium]
MPLAAGAPAPPFELPDGTGAPRSLAQLTAAGPALLAFFKTSCPTCGLAFPVVGELERRYGGAVPVAAVTQTPLAAALPWLEEHRFAGPVLDDERGRFSVSAAYQVRSVPTLVLVDGGRVVATSEGWDRDRMNRWASDLGALTGRPAPPVTTEGDGRPAYKPG